ncbi:MAG: hypothetical protein JHC26_00800 [Thermofilum sp.]|jgi:hypothetical protein|uniref:hypothetical protein n=1 Tax=Thermofilum sp. TaxID=1961369 RepID=UPI0025880666|nr:hypothetical protein [Thermofilum sp.]MCI4407603.1 hypothetical protein [Thermofilum sp.]
MSVSIIDVKREVELAIKTIVFSNSTRYIMFKAVKIQRANPILRNMNPSYIGRILNQVLREYEEKGLVRILGIKKNHVTKFYVRVNKSYSKYAERLEKEEVLA